MSKEEAARKEAIDDEEDEAEGAYNEIGSYKECLKLMRPGETVAKGIRRLAGGKKPTTQRKWQQKNKKTPETEEEKKNRELMTKLSGYADSILSRSGNMEIYEETYEKIAYRIKQRENQFGANLPLEAHSNDISVLQRKREEAKTSVVNLAFCESHLPPKDKMGKKKIGGSSHLCRTQT